VDTDALQNMFGAITVLGSDDRSAITDLFARAAALPDDRAALHPDAPRDDGLHALVADPIRIITVMRKEDRYCMSLFYSCARIIVLRPSAPPPHRTTLMLNSCMDYPPSPHPPRHDSVSPSPPQVDPPRHPHDHVAAGRGARAAHRPLAEGAGRGRGGAASPRRAAGPRP
jgi:hypothetical protein